MRIEIARLHRELGNTMVYVTHDQTEAMTLADKIVVLRDGRVEQVGTPRQLHEDPANQFVAGFIGSPKMNFLKAELQGDGTVLVAGTRLPLDVESPNSQQVALGLRPEHLNIGDAGALALEARVDFSEYQGGTRFAYCGLADGQLITVEHRGDEDLMPGRIVHLTCPPNQMRVFAATGQRLR